MTFQFPAIYDFPPFFTKQIHEETWRKQQELWADLIIGHSEAHRIFSLDVDKLEDTAPFANTGISRRVSGGMARELLDNLVKTGHAEPVGKSQYLLYWKKPTDWATAILEYVQIAGLNGSVVTVYELFMGDETQDEVFHGLPEPFWPRVFRALERSGKAALFGVDNQNVTISPETGIKFS